MAAEGRRSGPGGMLSPVRVCIVYDCLYPHTVGGAERWYRNVAERLAAAGHEVTYLTLRQWDRGERVDVKGVRVVTAGPRMALYVGGRRRIAPPLVFGAGVLWHLLRHGRRYDTVHSASFPYFSILAAGLARLIWRFELVVDWHEVWSRSYWREYLGAIGGPIGYTVQLLCARLPQRAFCFSELHARRLRAEGLRGEVTVLRGQYVAHAGASVGAHLSADHPDPLVVFAGRLIPEKRVTLGVAAVAAALPRLPGLRAVFYGDGPERERLEEAIAAHDLENVVSAPGFADAKLVDDDLGRALCMLLPSRREGYGKIVVEAAASGTPSVLTAEEDNAAVELIDEGVNGFVVPHADPQAIADAIVRVYEAGMQMRERTARWYEQNARVLSLESSLEVVIASYSRGPRRA